jgi:hypothetical protein
MDSMTKIFARLKALRNHRWTVAGICVAFVLLVTSSLLIVNGLTAPSTPPSSLANATSTSTISTQTDIPTLTPRPSPTHAPTATAVKQQPVSIVTAPPLPPIPTAPPAPPTPTAAPTTAPTGPTATASSTGTPATPTGPTATAAPQCPYYAGNNPSQSQISSALIAAADLYHLPHNLLLAVAWQESKWHQDVTACDGGIGLMQLQPYTYPWLNGQSVPACSLAATSYDPNTLTGNADLGAKYLAWLSCFYSYWGNNGSSLATLASPGAYTIDWYYQQAKLQYPDTLNSNGTPNSKSLCAAVFNNPSHPEYKALPSTTSDPWSCPYSAKAGDATLLDFTLSAYNEGPAYTDQYGIQNWNYVNGVEGFIPQFAAGSLPV